MNLQATIDILAGGQGSGCRGPKCGRPKKLFDRAVIAKTVAVDFDRTLAQHKFGAPGLGEPLPHGLELLKTLHQKGYTIHVLTARPDFAPVQDWLDKHGVGYAHATNNKPEASSYVDDRAVHWTGDESVESGVQQIEQMSKVWKQQERESRQKRTMGIRAAILIYGYGTPAGVRKEWDTRGRGRKAAPPKTTATRAPDSSLADSFLRVSKDELARSLSVKLAALINKGGGVDKRLYERMPLSSVETDISGVLERHHATAAYNTEENKMIVAASTHSGDDGYSMPEIASHEYGHQLYFEWLASPREWDLSHDPGTLAPVKGDDWNQAKATIDHDAMMKEFQTQADIVNKTLHLPEYMQLGTSNAAYATGQQTFQMIWGTVRRMKNLKYPGIRGLANPTEWFAEGFREYMSGDKARAALARNVPATYKLIDTFVHGGYFTKAAN